MNTPYRNPVHLYRALLRETTYLFNAAAQDFHAQHIRWSFRRHQRRERDVQDASSLLPSQRESHLLKRGRKYLYMLQRANQGYLRAVQNVLKMTYARKGKRRREMLKAVMAPSSADPLAPDTTSRLSPAIQQSSIWRPPPNFTTLLNSQSKIHTYLDVRGKVRAPLAIPEKNKWGNPFPKARIRTKIKRWYATNADLLMPPLSEEEWSNIYNLATGHADVTLKSKLKRRSIASIPVFSSSPDNDLLSVSDVANLARTDTRRALLQASRRVRSALGNPHNLTSRFKRRIIQRSILQSTPTTLADPDTGKTTFRWDSGSKPRPPPKVVSEAQNTLLFH